MRRVPCRIPVSWLSRRLSFYIFYPLERSDLGHRNVLEGRSSITQKTPKDYTICRYSDYRREHIKPMNVGALRALSTTYNSTRELFNVLIDRVDFVLSQTPPVHPFLRTTYLCYVAWSITLYKFFDGQPITIAEASLSKLSHGLLSSCLHALSEPDTDWENWNCSSDLIDHIYQNKLLIGRSEVCAASLNMIDLMVKQAFFQKPKYEQPIYAFDIDRLISFANIKLRIESLISCYDSSRIDSQIHAGKKLQDISMVYAFPLQYHLVQSYTSRNEKLFLENLHLRAITANPVTYSKDFTHSGESIARNVFSSSEEYVDCLNFYELELYKLFYLKQQDAHFYRASDLNIFLSGTATKEC
ncbi:hypothetical protein [Pseudomonas syringae]|uniref:hypothetical protein n=1 Tax=Pseudomonas syringae TaxID=317 RepID=UPI0002ADC544|nr:hypothetical protein [Pseudomonas syringae]ELS39946.1 Hypothetical protein PSSB64_0195 [Pseudomonas syringae pv. syringae B64]RML31526.1 hypothetical protein ALQ96_01918 [Pseudomonas syringae pv. atrofaciens]